ncbi:ArsA-related P-loop ATPase [Ammonicoccus fulvus]|uniref:ArsA-related P-loop ATPase n=1 Tax=Ammonicoccus fulvus TaxID=3138240 RepID=A0ABZ3FP87_9ACTN
MRSSESTGPLLHIVSGKGGTGKTTIAAALACALATDGRRVLLCEVEGRHAISELFGISSLAPKEERRLCRTPAGGQVYGLSVDAESALQEYLDTFYKLGMAGRALDKFGVFDFATSIAPGLRDVLLTGKVYESVRRKAKGRADAYDHVVLDAPPTGRITRFLNVHEAVAGLAKVGPIHNQAAAIVKLFRSEITVVHLVSLLEDMPVTETIEAVSELQPTGIRVGSVICNLVSDSPFTDAELAAAARRELPLDVPELDPDQQAALVRELAADASWIADERACRAQLETLGLPMVDVPRDPTGIDTGSLFAIANLLTPLTKEPVS